MGFYTALFLLCIAYGAGAQDQVKPSPKLKTKKEKKALKAEKKEQQKSKKEMEKQVAVFHKKKYGDIPKAKKNADAEK
jgi:hypothetical protein